MKNELWKQVSELFQSAIKLDQEQRTIYLKNACGENNALFRQVKSLVDAHESADDAGFMDVPAVDRVARMLIKDETLAGETIGHHKIVKRLGAGGMGEVYLGNDTTLNRPVAIKVLLAETARDKERIRRFVQEARAASALNHPNILTVYQVGDHKGSRFIATEYIDGETLRDKIVRSPLALSEVLDIAVQISAALDAAHNAGIIHRDIKPENVMIRNDGLVKVLDFGLAKLTESGVEAENLHTVGPEAETRDQILTRAGAIMGTTAYMSPEQARGLPVDVRSDIWSLAVLIFEMVSRQQPFIGDTMNDTIAAILTAEPAPLEGVPAELNAIITKALSKSADERYQKVNELLSDLREFKQELEFAVRLERGGSSLKATDSRSDSLPSAPPRKVIAVMPFVNASGNPDHEYLSDGLTESLIGSLSQLPNITMKARSSVFQYKGKDVSPQTIGRELSVQAALLGRVTRHNERLTFSLELVDTQSGDLIWAEQYDREQAELPGLQSEITRDVAMKLGLRLSGASGQRAEKADTTDPRAYQLYLQGLYHLNKRTAEDIRKGIALFEQATEKDPAYARAHASLSMAYGLLRVYSAKLTREEMKELHGKSHASVLRAQELDDSLAEVHAGLANSYEHSWDFVAAETEYKRAIELNPNLASTHSFYSLHLSWRGWYETALAEINKAYELDPFSRSIAFNIGARLADARRFDDAIAQYKRVLEMEPDHPLTHHLLAQALDAKGMYAEAIPEYRAADVLLEKESPEIADRKAAELTEALRSGGAKGYWQKRLQFSREEYERGNGYAYRIAVNYARLGDVDRAFEQLETAFSLRELYLLWVGTESAFDTMKHDPRFDDLLQRMGLKF